ncbi:MAG: DNA cytosine methyltransferase [Cyanobacteriota bacterium]|nr:DNA cytosine methyltransferase [Cyanobacteriota bacterium]
MTKKIKIFSFFSGSGFLDLGFENSGFNIAFVNEFFAPFLRAYRYSREVLKLPEPEYGYYEENIVNFTAEKKTYLQDLIANARQSYDLIGFIGGPPCPDFSVGGKNRGKAGEKGKLSGAYIELICQQQPDFFVFENVKGLWRTKKHRRFYEEMKAKLYEGGYLMTEKLINAIAYKVPQDRERIILIGFRTDLLTDKGLETGFFGISETRFFEKTGFLDRYSSTIPEGIFPWGKHTYYREKEVFSYPWPTTNPFQENSEINCPNNIPEELTVEYWFRKNMVDNHPNARHYFQPRAGKIKMETVAEGDDSKKSYKRLHRWRYSPTACYGNNEVHLHPYKIRRLSAAEALAIQSLPREFALPENMTLSNMFKTIGNGVPYFAAKGIAESILDFWLEIMGDR